jgi:hypothetical protein
MAFNIRFGAGSEEPGKPGYDVPSSSAKIRAVAEAISSVAPDVVALQEVRDASQAGHIARLLGMKTVYSRHPAAYSLDFFEWGLALFCGHQKTFPGLVRNPASIPSRSSAIIWRGQGRCLHAGGPNA